MRVALLYPGITECGFNSLKGNEGTWMHHGLAILSNSLKQKGHEVILLDLRRFLSWENFNDEIKNMNFQVVAITMMSVDYNPACNAAKIIKEVKPESIIIVGGPHPSLCPEELENLTFFDYIIKGEGEISLPELIDSIEKRNDLPKVIVGKRLEDLDEGPWADRDLFQSPEEPFVSFLKPPFVTLIAGRGCRYNCNYCQPAERIMFGHKVRRRSVNNIISELKMLRDKFHFNSWMLHDDCITEDREWVMEFTRKYKEAGFTQPFVCQSRADIICRNEDMVKSLSDVGLRLFIIGFESGSNRVLKFLRKGCTREMNLQAAVICRKYGIKIWANYMLGLPTETKEEVMETFTMLQQIKPFHCSPAFYTPHPGSDLFAWGQKMGIHLIVTHDSYRRNSYEPKIKGPDYDFLKEMLYKTIALEEDITPVRAQLLTRFSAKNIDIFFHTLKKSRTLFSNIQKKMKIHRKPQRSKIHSLVTYKDVNVEDFSSINFNIELKNCREIKKDKNNVSFKTNSDDPQILLSPTEEHEIIADDYSYLKFHLFTEISSVLQIIWYTSSGIGITENIITKPGGNIYILNLAKINLQSRNTDFLPWKGIVQKVRIDPALQPDIKMIISDVQLCNNLPIEILDKIGRTSENQSSVGSIDNADNAIIIIPSDKRNHIS
jgi:anaerobic magnesium-protoporphyrin IX monomethyl ester cyclase